MRTAFAVVGGRTSVVTCLFKVMTKGALDGAYSSAVVEPSTLVGHLISGFAGGQFLPPLLNSMRVLNPQRSVRQHPVRAFALAGWGAVRQSDQ